MKWLCFAVLLGGCITINSAPSDNAGTDHDGSGDGSGSGSGSDDDVIGGDCSLKVSAGPHGALADFDVAADGTRWLLTYPDNELPAELWVNTGAGWVQRPIDFNCHTGMVRADSQGRAHVLCNVWTQTFPANAFIAHATVTPQSSTSETLIAAPIGQNSGALLVAADLAPDGKPAFMWLMMVNGEVSGSYHLSRFTSGFWTERDYVLEHDIGVSPNYGYNDQIRMLFAGSDLFIGYRDTTTDRLHIASAPATESSSLTPVLTVAAPGGSEDDLNFVTKYDFARDAGGAFHVVVYDSPSAGAGTLTYFQQSGTNLAQVGPTPVTDGGAGKGVSLVIGPNDVPVMSYYASASGGIRVSAFDGAGWSHHDLDTTGIGYRSRARFDGSELLHVAYQDVAVGGVKLVDEVCP